LEKKLGCWPVQNGNKFATGQTLKNPVEVVKGRILAGLFSSKVCRTLDEVTTNLTSFVVAMSNSIRTLVRDSTKVDGSYTVTFPDLPSFS
jgi:hypothetical protein